MQVISEEGQDAVRNRKTRKRNREFQRMKQKDARRAGVPRQLGPAGERS